MSAAVPLAAPETWATIIAIDPSLTRTGWAVLAAPIDPTADRLRLIGGSRRVLAYGSGAARAEGSLRHVWLDLASHVPIDRPWVACVEMFPPMRRGEGSAPIVARAEAITWVESFARERAKALRQAYRRPLILAPTPDRWRAPLGLATKAPHLARRPKAERSAFLKAQAVRLAELELRDRYTGPATALDHDAAEAVCLGCWALREPGSLGAYVRRKGAAPEPLRLVA